MNLSWTCAAKASYIIHIVSCKNFLPAFLPVDHPWLELDPLSAPNICQCRCSYSTSFDGCNQTGSPPFWLEYQGNRWKGSWLNSQLLAFKICRDTVVSSTSEGHAKIRVHGSRRRLCIFWSRVVHTTVVPVALLKYHFAGGHLDLFCCRSDECFSFPVRNYDDIWSRPNSDQEGDGLFLWVLEKKALTAWLDTLSGQTVNPSSPHYGSFECDCQNIDFNDLILAKTKSPAGSAVF